MGLTELTVHYRSTFGTQTWTLSGPTELVQAWVDELLRRYPSEGYGTKVERRKDAVVVTAYSVG